MRFYSKKGIFIGSVLWGSILFMVFAFLFLPGGPKNGGDYLIAVLICGTTSAFIMWIWFQTYYEIGEEYIKIVSGPIRSRLQISAITSIRRTRNPLSSPALSTDRLEIKHGKWGVALISPKDEERFCEVLQKKNPKITVELEKH